MTGGIPQDILLVMTDQQKRWLRQLAGCTFLPGSYDKRFVRDLNARLAANPESELTEKQAAFLRKTAYRYRKQRGDPDMTRPL